MVSTGRAEVARPGPHPPPPELDGRPLPLRTLDQPWFRVHPRALSGVFFGRSGLHRFDAPEGEFGVLYLGADPHAAFIETFGHGHAGADRLVTLRALRRRLLSRVELDRPLRLVDLTESGLVRIGADMRLCTGDYTVAQRWSAALRGHADAPDGLLYRSRHDGARLCAAVFDRAAPAASSTPLGALSEPVNRRLLADLLDTYDFGLGA